MDDRTRDGAPRTFRFRSGCRLTPPAAGATAGRTLRPGSVRPTPEFVILLPGVAEQLQTGRQDDDPQLPRAAIVPVQMEERSEAYRIEGTPAVAERLLEDVVEGQGSTGCAEDRARVLNCLTTARAPRARGPGAHARASRKSFPGLRQPDDLRFGHDWIVVLGVDPRGRGLPASARHPARFAVAREGGKARPCVSPGGRATMRT
jgi:hypothetical protein